MVQLLENTNTNSGFMRPKRLVSLVVIALQAFNGYNIYIITLVLSAISFMFVGCTNAKETSKQTDGVAADTTTGSTTEYDTTENETTTAKKVWREQQVLSGAKRIDVGVDMGNKLIGFHCIPSFCVWDDEFGGYIANNNDTNTNGESLK